MRLFFRRFITLPALALFAVVAVFTGFDTMQAHASGCGDNGWWHQIGYASAGNTDVLGQNASTDITLWQDGCGNAQARWSVWSNNGASLSSIVTAGRVWICGGSGGGAPSFNVQEFSSVTWSGWFNAAGCGVGVDDALGGGGWGTQACTSAACYNANNFGVFYDNI